MQPTCTVLIVDDEPAVRSILSQLLEKEGYAVISTGNPRNAIRLLEKCPGTYCSIILDVDMPGMTGIEFLEKVKRVDGLHDLPVFVFTGGNAELDAGPLREASVFLKPSDLDALLSSVKRLCA